MKFVTEIFALFFLFLAFQTASGQASSGDESRKVKIISGKAKESKKDVNAQKNAYPNLKLQSNQVSTAFLAEDFDKYSDFMYWEVLAVTGRIKFISDLQTTISNLRANGVEFVGYKIGDPTQKIEMDSKVFVVLPYETKMKNPQKITTEEGNLLAISEDNGENWKFIRATSKERLRWLFPKLVDKLIFSESRTK